MNKIFAIAKMDARHVFTNVISLVVCVGMIVVPSFYAWFNTAGSWDPYGNTQNLRIALANSDEGYKSELLPVEINLGERTVSELRASKSIGYVVTDEDDAREGVASGDYYAAIVIPADFSRSMLTNLVGGDSDSRPTVEYVSNQKRNAIANIVTQKASSAVSQTIDESFVRTAVEVGAGALEEMGNYLNDDQLNTIANNLDDALVSSGDNLRHTSDNLNAYASLVGSIRNLTDDANSTLADVLSESNGIGSTLRSSATGVRQFDSALGSASSSLGDTLSKASSSYDDVESSIDNAFDTAGGATDTLIEKLGDAKAVVDRQNDGLKDLLSDLQGTDTLATSHERSLDVGSTEYSYVHTIRLTIEGLNDRVSAAQQRAQSLSDGIQDTINDLSSAKTDANTAKSRLESLVSQAKGSMSDVQADYESGLGSSLTELASGIDNAADTADSLLTQLSDTSSKLGDTATAVDGDLAGLQDALTNAAGTLDSAANDLDTLRSDLRTALDSNDLAQVRQILSASPESLAEFISEPIQLDRNAVYPVANNGSAMAPFYSVLSIWIGAVILCALVKTSPSKRMLDRIGGVKPHQAYFGRIIFFVIIGLLQTALIAGGDLFFLGIQCEHPVLFFLACFVASLVFVNLVFSLTASFGDVGKAIAVLLMVLQVAGSGGTFPMEMLPKAFQAVYPFLPFVHAENALRSAIAGLYGMDFWISLGILAAFLVPSLFLGLVLRRPVIRLNHWFEHQLESTKVM